MKSHKRMTDELPIVSGRYEIRDHKHGAKVLMHIVLITAVKDLLLLRKVGIIRNWHVCDDSEWPKLRDGKHQVCYNGYRSHAMAHELVDFFLGGHCLRAMTHLGLYITQDDIIHELDEDTSRIVGRRLQLGNFTKGDWLDE